MRRHITRLAAATLTFLLGAACFWLWGLVGRAQYFMLDLLMPTPAVETPRGVRGEADGEGRDAAAVYEAVIRNMLPRDIGGLAVISAETSGCDVCEAERSWVSSGQTGPFRESVGRSLPAAAETLDDYLKKNRGRGALAAPGLRVRHALVSRAELEDLFDYSRAGDFWARFRARYPAAEGLLSFSQVGFNRGRTEAFVYAAWSCGSLCGGGSYVHLRKARGVWVVENKIGLWVS